MGDDGTGQEEPCAQVDQISGRYMAQMQVQMEVANLDFCEFVDCRFRLFADKAAFYGSSSRHRGVMLQFKDEKTGDVTYDVWMLDTLSGLSTLQQQIDESMWTMRVIEDRLKSWSYMNVIYWEIHQYFIGTVERDRVWFTSSCLPKLKECFVGMQRSNHVDGDGLVGGGVDA